MFQKTDKVFVMTKGETIISNSDHILNDHLISYNTAEEADQKLIRHTIQCIRSGMEEITVATVDTDVIISLIAYRPLVQHLECKVFASLSSPSGITILISTKFL